MKLHHTNITFKDYNPRNSDQFVFEAVDKSDVMQIIFNMKSSSSTGHEMFSNKLIKLIRDELLEPFTLIIKQVLDCLVGSLLYC